jgi:hypothetical protein
MATNRDSQGPPIRVNADVCPDGDLPVLLRSKPGIAYTHWPFWTLQIRVCSSILALFYLSTKYQKHNQTP